MALNRVRFSSFLALSAAISLTAGCGGSSGSASNGGDEKGKGPVVVATTTWEGAFAKAAGAEDVKVIVPQSVQHAPDYDPKPTDLATVAKADYVLYAPFEPYAAKIKEAAGSKAELVETKLDNDPRNVKSEVTRLAGKFGTEDMARKWNKDFGAKYGKLSSQLKSSWKDGERPTAVSQVFTVWSARMAGAKIAGTFGPEAVTAGQLSKLSKKKPGLVVDNEHMSTGTVLPDSDAKQVKVANYPGEDLELWPVYRKAAAELRNAMS
ncbi:ABC transporter substrate-binding protein [Streptomyces abyssalis]|uniref:ABC transporter substrate-binding protein n=1 Tax=Streptomyces abyssalis TaxID=933944 RepID=A0A1E7JN42_9ACTN|nr:zinc ABC transporter substrate-binding protein [Streptomyces abyssalis]OEU86913.1 ABC transporter substrate-binding protein [Streptomyces abyssalis]OEU89702.1 ABC transporter substrate-binding protein [Streptomyces abyssalis]